MIEGVLIINSTGNLRFIKIYTEEEKPNERENLIKRIFQSMTNSKEISVILDFEYMSNQRKLVYKAFGSIYIALLLDDSENELAILDFISVMMQCFDEIFKGVCELHFIMNPEKIYYIVDEMISGGIVIETSKSEIISNYNEKLKDLDK